MKERPNDPVAVARRTLLEGVGAEVAASFPNTTRLGGEIVAALYLADQARSMDELALELGRSKSNIFANLRGLEAAGIVERRRDTGARHESFALRGSYPDVIIGAYLARLRRVISEKRALSEKALSILGNAKGTEADGLRSRAQDLARKYERFGAVFEAVLPSVDGPVDLEAMFDAVPLSVFKVLASIAKRALGMLPATRR